MIAIVLAMTLLVPVLDLPRQVARLEAQLVEKDRQLAELQYRTGVASLDLQRRLLEADALAAELQLTARATAVVERLRVLEKPLDGATYDLKSGRWLLKEKP